jgi:hypothetical protein
VSMVILLMLGPACVFYGYVLVHFWREATARRVEPEAIGGIVALPESSALQMQLDRAPVHVYAPARFGPDARPRLEPTKKWQQKATVHRWPGTKDAA